MLLLLSSFLAGMLTSLAPCMITLLPVIVGNAVLSDKDKKIDRKKPYVIATSLALSVIIFTVLLKVSTVLIGVDPKLWLYVSGGIVLLLGVTMLFPNLWVKVSNMFGLEHGSNKLLTNASKHSGLSGQILTGAALGPVFTSCSPVYALVLATVLPINLALGMIYIIAFALGLGLALLIIALGGQKLAGRLGWTANPNGWFRKGLAVLLIIVGIAIIGGYDKKFQTWAIEKLPFDVTDIEQKLIPGSSPKNAMNNSNSVFNVNKPYQAPEIKDIQAWVNNDPQTMEQLKGKVVLIDFWTYSCINCIRTQPYLNSWYEKYQDDGLEILGIHAPEFAFEKVTKNVEEAVVDAKIQYPVGLDNNFSTWNAYENKYWPAKYLIDKNGLVRYTHFGEGDYVETEQAIQTLLEENGSSINEKITEEISVPTSKNRRTPETYLSYSRGERFANVDQLQSEVSVNYTLSYSLKPDEWSLGGNWIMGREASVSGNNAKLKIKFSAKEVHLVMSGARGAKINLSIDGKPLTNAISIDTARLYTLIKSDTMITNKELVINFPPGVTINAFTFGS